MNDLIFVGLDRDKNTKNYGILLVVLGIFWIILNVIDRVLFIYHPFEVNMMIDLGDLREMDRLKL